MTVADKKTDEHEVPQKRDVLIKETQVFEDDMGKEWGRGKVPGGWLVWNMLGGMIFYPDPQYVWKP